MLSKIRQILTMLMISSFLSLTIVTPAMSQQGSSLSTTTSSSLNLEGAKRIANAVIDLSNLTLNAVINIAGGGMVIGGLVLMATGIGGLWVSIIGAVVLCGNWIVSEIKSTAKTATSGVNAIIDKVQ